MAQQAGIAHLQDLSNGHGGVLNAVGFRGSVGTGEQGTGAGARKERVLRATAPKGGIA